MTLWRSCNRWDNFTIFNIASDYYFRIFHQIYFIVEESNNRSDKKWIGPGLFDRSSLFIEKFIKPITYFSPSSHIPYWLKLSPYMKDISFDFSESLYFMIFGPSILSLPIHSGIPWYIWMILLFLPFNIKIAWSGELFSCHLQYLFIIGLIF